MEKHRAYVGNGELSIPGKPCMCVKGRNGIKDGREQRDIGFQAEKGGITGGQWGVREVTEQKRA